MQGKSLLLMGSVWRLPPVEESAPSNPATAPDARVHEQPAVKGDAYTSYTSREDVATKGPVGKIGPPRTMGISDSLQWLTTLTRVRFFSEEWPLFFWKPRTVDFVV